MIPYEQQQNFVIGTLTLPSLLGVILAIVAAMACFIPARRMVQVLPQSPARAADLRFWYAVAAILLAVALWRALGAEAAVQAWGRDAARAGQWYDQRRFSQSIVVSLALIAALGVAMGLLRLLSGRRREIAIAALAVAGLLGLALMRLISLHLVDQFLYSGPIRMNWILEPGLLIVIIAAAIHTARTTHAPKRMRRRKD